MKLEVLSTEVLSADNVREVCKGEDGKRYERLTQKIDKKTGMLASRSRSLSPEIVDNIVVRELPEEIVKLDSTNPSSSISEEERLAIVEGKMQAKQEKLDRQQESIRVAQLDEDDEKAENEKSESQREMDKAMIERNQQAAKNVDEVLNLQNDLKAQGKSKQEIKASVNALKQEQKQRGRPKADALKSPVKNPETGEFQESEDGE